MSKKGFTLIELLATIVIITILSLITIPLVLGIVDKAKKGAFEDSVKVSSKQIEMYLFENGLSDIPDDGIKVKKMNIKSDFISGTFKSENGKLVADKIRNKDFCASGPIDKLIIKKDCGELDTTPPILDETKLIVSKSSNSITINILDGFAIEEESYIKSYEIIIYDNDKKIDSKMINDIGSVKFVDLNSNKEYKIEVVATNSNNLFSKVAKNVATSEINKPTYAVSPSGWAQNKTVTITYPSGYTNEYSLDGGTTWKSYTKALNFTSNGTVIARVSDGKNYVTAASQTVSQIDTTKPSAASFTYTTTSKSITVVATGTDAESKITHYQFSKDNGSTWTEVQTSNTYTFSNLSTGSYNIKVKVINGTYTNVKAVNANNSLDSTSQAVSTASIDKPTYAVSPSGWAQNKTVTITYPSGYTNEYSLDGGVTWKSYTKTLNFTANGTVIARVNDGKNYATAASQTVSQIDTTKPTAASFTHTTTSKSITVVATGTDAESGITHYQFSKDNGSTWTAVQTPNTYTFSNLSTGSYNIKVKVINGTYTNVKAVNANNSLDSAAQAVSTAEITKPIYAVSPSGWAQNKTVTITYPNGYTNEYSLDGGVTWKSYTAPISFSANGTVIARVSDGKNYVTAASQTVSQIDTTKPTVASFTYSTTSKSIKVIASGTDAESKITHYQFSKDNGSTWTAVQASNTYTFSNLSTGSYNIKIKVINGTYANVKVVNTNNSLDSAAQAISTTAITTPTYAVSPSGWALSKTVTITYPSGYTNEYSLDGGKTWKSYTNPIILTDLGSTSATVIARVNDGKNYVTAASQTVTQIYLTSAENVSFTPADSNWKVSNVYEALEYLRNN